MSMGRPKLTPEQAIAAKLRRREKAKLREATPECKLRAREKSARYMKKHRERLLALQKLFRAEHPEVIRARNKLQYERNRDKHVQRKRAYARRHIIGVERMEQVLLFQGGVCAICRRADTHMGGTLKADHDHATGVFRGMLCHACNVTLGHYENSMRPHVQVSYFEDYLNNTPYSQCLTIHEG